MNRLTAREWLDEEGIDSAELERSLDEVWDVNRRFGAARRMKWLVQRLVGETSEPLRILDVGTGAGDIPLALSHWARKAGRPATVVGVDNHPQMVELAKRRTVKDDQVVIQLADGRSLPFGDGSFDVAVSNLVLHHLDEDEAKQLFRELARVSRRGWVVLDLERHPAAFALAQVFARCLWRSPITRHDGPLSVRRAYRRNEVASLLEAVGVRAEVRSHIPFQLSVVGHG